MASQDGPNDEFIKTFLLTPLSDERRAAYFGKFQDHEAIEDDLDCVKPQIIEWPSDQGEGSIEADDPERARFQYFADRQSVDRGTVILAHRDLDTMLHSPETAQEITKLAAESGITLPEDWTQIDRVVEELMDDLEGRGVAWGRIPISKWRSSWCNADIGNIHEHEFIEYCRGRNSILRDQEWDSDKFGKTEGGGPGYGNTTCLSL